MIVVNGSYSAYNETDHRLFKVECYVHPALLHCSKQIELIQSRLKLDRPIRQSVSQFLISSWPRSCMWYDNIFKTN